MYQSQEEFKHFEPTEGKNYFVIASDKSRILQKQISDYLQKEKPYLWEVRSVEDCDVILVFCPIVSRAGTDIDAAMTKLNELSASKPAIFMVFHLSYDPDKVIPDSSRYIKRSNTLAVDCLFSEEEGLFQCDRNTEALTKIAHCFKHQESFAIPMTNNCRNNCPISVLVLFGSAVLILIIVLLPIYLSKKN